MKYLIAWLMVPVTALANVVANGPLPSAPPKGNEIVAFANSPEGYTQRILLTQKQLCAFLDKGKAHFILPQELQKRLEGTRLGQSTNSNGEEVISLPPVVCGGAFSDRKKNMYFWSLAAPEFLGITDEKGTICIIYLAPSPLEADQLLRATGK